MTMDDASADLILALQIQDLADLAADRDGEGAEDDDNSDGKIARDLYREELRNNAAMVLDFRFGEKLGEATDEEPPSPLMSATPNFDLVLARSFGLLPTEDDSSSPHPQDTTYPMCVICMNVFSASHLITAPCGHHYCKTCTGQLYELAMKDESLFPPRCCRQQIPLETASPLLTAAQLQKYDEKRIEFDTSNRTYCFDTSCGAFVAPANVSGEKAMCHCGALTCIVCKAAAHDGDCSENPAYASLMAVAAAEKYQTCQQCGRLVELSIGCNHIT